MFKKTKQYQSKATCTTMSSLTSFHAVLLQYMYMSKKTGHKLDII